MTPKRVGVNVGAGVSVKVAGGEVGLGRVGVGLGSGKGVCVGLAVGRGVGLAVGKGVAVGVISAAAPHPARTIDKTKAALHSQLNEKAGVLCKLESLRNGIARHPFVFLMMSHHCLL